MNYDLDIEKRDDISKDYLLAELQSSVIQRHNIDERIDKEIQYYFTFLGGAITIIALLVRFGFNNLNVPTILAILGVAHLFFAVIIIAGFRLLRRVIHLTGVAALLNAQSSLIRKKFVDADKPLSPYVLTIASKEHSVHDFPQQLAVHLLSIANALLLTSIIMLFPVYFYFYEKNTIQLIWPWLFQLIWSWPFRIIIAAIAISAGVGFWIFQRKMCKRKGDEYLEHITEDVQQRLVEIANTKLSVNRT